MKQTELLHTLRTQAINDELGTVCCRPREKAAEYFDLAKKMVETPEREEQLLDLLLRLVGGERKDHPYEVWSCLFDGLTDMLEGRPLRSRVRAVALDQCIRSAARSEPDMLRESLDVFLSKPELWSDTTRTPLECLPRIVQPISSNLELSPAQQVDLDRITSCLATICDHMGQQQEAAPLPSVLDLVGSLLQPDSDTDRDPLDQTFQNSLDPRWLRCRMAAMLLEYADQPDQCTRHVAILYRDACQALATSPQALANLLQRARDFFSQLNEADVYRDLYRFALHVITIHLSNHPTPADLKVHLLASHPHPADIEPWVEILWDSQSTGVRPAPVQGIDHPDWVDLFFFVLREENPERRMEQARRWLYRRMQHLFCQHPDLVSTFVQDAVQPAFRLSGSTTPDYMAWLAAPSLPAAAASES